MTINFAVFTLITRCKHQSLDSEFIRTRWPNSCKAKRKRDLDVNRLRFDQEFIQGEAPRCIHEGSFWTRTCKSQLSRQKRANF